MSRDWIVPDWPAPASVKALITTRQGGVSRGAYAGLNLGDHVGDSPEHVAANRALLQRQLTVTLRWLKQVHGVQVADAGVVGDGFEADAAHARSTYVACAVLTADCLPLLVCDRAGTHVAAIHAGWRGLNRGVIEATLAAMGERSADLLVYLGPAIGPNCYEVGDDVRDAFITQDARTASAFIATENGKWMANLYQLARQRLHTLGVEQIFGGALCTASDAARFYSYRRDGVTGRTASLIWLDRR